VSAPVVLALMSFCFLFFGYLGVPVPFSLMAGVFRRRAAGLTFAGGDHSEDFSTRGFRGAAGDPVFLLVGELMSSANVVVRIANLSLSLVGHIGAGCRRSSSSSACSSRRCRDRPPPTSRS